MILPNGLSVIKGNNQLPFVSPGFSIIKKELLKP